MELVVYMGIYINCWRVSKYFPDIFFPNFHTSLAFIFIYSTFKSFLQGQLHYSHIFAVTQKIDHLVTDCKVLVGTPLDLILSFCFGKVCFNSNLKLIHRSFEWALLFQVFQPNFCTNFSFCPHVLYVSYCPPFLFSPLW